MNRPTNQKNEPIPRAAVRFGGSVVDEPAPDACLRADAQVPGANLRVAVHDTVQAQLGRGHLQVFVRVAVELHLTPGQRGGAGDHGRGADSHVAARDPSVAGDDRVQADGATGGIDIVADASADRDFPARGDQVTLDLRGDRHLASGQESVPGDRFGHVQQPASGELIRAEPPGNRISLVVFPAAAGHEGQRQGQDYHCERAADPAHRHTIPLFCDS
jgi:hypothetical protein